MTYDDILDAWKSRLPRATFQSLLCDEAMFAFQQCVKDGIVVDERTFISEVIAFGRRFQDHVREGMGAAWGEDQ